MELQAFPQNILNDGVCVGVPLELPLGGGS